MTVNVNSNYATFRITSVRPYHHDDSTAIPQDHSDGDHDDSRDVRNDTDNDNFVPELEPVRPKRG